MSKFDDKLTLLTKQFHFMPPGLISDILNQVGCDVQEAQNIISAMIPDQNDEKPIEDDDDEDDDELQKVLELSRAENVEKETLLKIVAETEKQNLKTNSSEKENSRPKNNHTNDDMTKSPDPPPKPREPHPGNSENQAPKPMNFAQKAAQPSTVQQSLIPSRIRVDSQSDRIEVKDGFNLYIMRGLPGSGKSTLANKIRQKYVDANKRGVICSADDYFYDSRGNYMWDPNRLTEAHEFCKQKSERHMNMGFEAVIIDNTNIEIWHMIFYATMALRFRYRISIEEPTTTWKLNVRELAKRNKHGCPPQTISVMKQKWEMCTTAELVKFARNQQQGNSIPPQAIQVNPFQPPIHLINAPPIPMHILPPTQRMIRPMVSLPRPHLAHSHPPPVSSAPPGHPRMQPTQLQSTNKSSPIAQPKAQKNVMKPPQNQATPPQIKPKSQVQFQVQANAKNVPESVSRTMLPADPVDPEIEAIEQKYRREMKRNQLMAQSSANAIITKKEESSHVSVQATTTDEKSDENCLPADLLDDEDNEDADLVEINHPPSRDELMGSKPDETDSESDLDTESEIDLPPELSNNNDTDTDQSDHEISSQQSAPCHPNPIGHGRQRSDRLRNPSESLITTEDSDFDFLNQMTNDWGSMAKKMTHDQIGGQSLWSSQCAVTDKKSTFDKRTQTNDGASESTDKEKIIHKKYRSVDPSIHESRILEGVTNDKATQTEDQNIIEQKRILSQLKELFPDFDGTKLEQFVIRSNCNLDRAIDLLSEDNQTDDPGTNESFNLLPEVLNTWNEIIDMDEIERGFEAFDLEYQECYQSV